MDKNALISSLNELADHVNSSVEDINSGGCCVFAHLVGQHLQKIVPTKVLVADDAAPRGADLCIIREKIDECTVYSWNAWEIYFGHVLLEFSIGQDRYHFDSTGVERARPNSKIKYDPYFTIIPGHLTVKDAEELANSAGWNMTFNRRKIPTMRRIIDSQFKAILAAHGVIDAKRQPREWRYGDFDDRIAPRRCGSSGASRSRVSYR